MGIYLRFVDSDFTIMSILIPVVPAIIITFWFDRLTLKNNVYLKYFRYFDNKDGFWYAKWQIITFLLCVGSLPAVIGAAAIAIKIASIQF